MSHSKVFSGVIWASVQRFGNLAISFVSTMVMARLLSPNEFGVIGMLMFFLALAQTFVDSGLGAALVQKKELDILDTSTAFYVNIILSSVLYCILFLCAPAISRFYNLEIVCPLLRVMGLTLFIQGFTLVQSSICQKELQFKTLSICNLIGSITLAIIGICAALAGCGVWSFVIRSLSGSLISSILLWKASNWRPKFIFSRDRLKHLFNFGGFMLLSSLCITISNNVQSLVIGKMFSPSILGKFTQAKTLRNIPADSIQQVIGQVLFPEFSKHQDHDEIIKDKLNKSVYILSFLVIPMMLLCIIIAKPLILFFYGEKWIEAVPYFQILCIGGIPYCIQDVNINVIKAKGKSRTLFYLNLVKAFVFCGMTIVGGIYYGLQGLLYMAVIYNVLAYLCFAIVGTGIIKTNICEQLKAISKCLFYACIPFVVSIYLNSYLEVYMAFIRITVISFIYIIIYLCVSWMCKSEALKYLLHQVSITHKTSN